MKYWSKISLISSFIVALFTYMAWGYFKDYHNISIFYTGIALTFTGYTFVIWNEAKGLWKIISRMIMITCISSFVDELFFNPKILQLNEFIAFALILVFLCEDLILYKQNG